MSNDIDVTFHDDIEVEVQGILPAIFCFINGDVLTIYGPDGHHLQFTLPSPQLTIHPDLPVQNSDPTYIGSYSEDIQEGQYHLELDETKLESKGKSVSIDEALAKIDEALEG